MSKIINFTFYYLMPSSLGFVTGLCIRDSFVLSSNKKISMALADYYETTHTEIDDQIGNKFPEVKKLLKTQTEKNTKKDN